MSIAAIAVAAVMYPFLAGVMFRLLGKPQPCGGENMARGYTTIRCEGVGAHASCRACRSRSNAIVAAALWPLAIPALCLRSVFRAGAGQLGSGGE